MADIVRLSKCDYDDDKYVCFINDVIQDATINRSGRYVRESDYNALMERHRRLVNQVKYCLKMSGNRWSEWGDRAHEVGILLEAALAEEVDDGLK